MEYYIKKNDVVSMLMKEAKSHGLSFSAEAYERAANLTACMPNEEVQPIKHGRWTWDPNAPYREHGAYKCSNCGCHSDFKENYCYNCGARMDGDTE